jgi:hypothetical protein
MNSSQSLNFSVTTNFYTTAIKHTASYLSIVECPEILL